MRATGPTPGPALVRKDRLDSWKEIAAYLNRDIRTVQRWERHFDLPVHRHPGGPKAGVFALPADLDLWLQAKRCEVETASVGHPPVRNGDLNESSRPGRGRVLQGRRLWLYAGALSICFVLMATALIWIRSRRATEQPRLGPMTGSSGEIGAVTFSPDGTRVAYTWRPEDGRPAGIYVKVIGAGDPMPLATGRNEREPAWSPDGRFIAYYRDPPGLYLIPALGGAERKIADTKDTAFLGRRMAWFPDGKRLAVAELDPKTGFRGIVELSVDTRAWRRLTSGLSTFGDNYPAFLPDGKKLAFVRHPSSGSAAVYLIPAAGGEAHRLTESPASTFDWTADGREIIYSTNKDGFNTLWRVMVAGGPARRMVEAGYDATAPAVAHTGNRMAFWHGVETVNLWRLDFAQPSKPRRLAPTNRRQSSPQYSPDGTKLAFMSNRAGHTEIWTSDAEGGNLMSLTSMGTQGTFAGTPRWSPDGLDIAFDARPGGNPDVYIVSAQGGASRRVTTGPAEDVLPSFSGDGRWIYFSANRSGDFQIWKVARTGGDAVQVTTQGGVAGLESADGKYLYYMNYRHNNELWRIPVGGGAEEMLYKGAAIWKGAAWRRYWGWWTVGAGGIVFVDRSSSGPQTPWQLKRFDPGSHRISVLAEMPRQPAVQDPCVTVSPDGRSAIYSQVEDSVRTFMLLENFR